MDASIIELIDAIAWPAVALATVLVLGPGGVLHRFTESLGRSISDFTRALPELKSTALTMRSDVDTLVEKSKEMSRGVSKELQDIEGRIDILSNRLTSALNDIRAVVDDIDRSKISENQAEIAKSIEELNPDRKHDADTEDLYDTHHSPDVMLEEMRSSFNLLVADLRTRLGNSDFDARQIGAMAYKLTDGRRSHPITSQDAELIGRLHSQYKRFTRMQSSKEEWLTPDVFRTFQKGIEEARKVVAFS